MHYLGFPISARSWCLKDCQVLVEKVTTRLHCWTTRNLSFAGRLQLISSVIQSFHIYWASAFLIPKGILEAIDKNFATSYGLAINQRPNLF